MECVSIIQQAIFGHFNENTEEEKKFREKTSKNHKDNVKVDIKNYVTLYPIKYNGCLFPFYLNYRRCIHFKWYHSPLKMIQHFNFSVFLNIGFYVFFSLRKESKIYITVGSYLFNPKR